MDRMRATRKRAGLVASGLGTLLLGGCTMCPDIYDYSGPVPNGTPPQNDFRARSNGIEPIGSVPQPWPALVERDQPDHDPPAVDGPVLVKAEDPIDQVTR